MPINLDTGNLAAANVRHGSTRAKRQDIGHAFLGDIVTSPYAFFKWLENKPEHTPDLWDRFMDPSVQVGGPHGPPRFSSGSGTAPSGGGPVGNQPIAPTATTPGLTPPAGINTFVGPTQGFGAKFATLWANPAFKELVRVVGIPAALKLFGGSEEDIAQFTGAGVGGIGSPAMNDAAMANLFEILMGRGQTDPAMLNRQITDIARGSEAQQQNIQSTLAQRGLGRSGVGQALSAAAGQAGEARIADARAQETARAEDRRRQDLQLFNQLVQGPSLDLAAINAGVQRTNKEFEQPSFWQTAFEAGLNYLLNRG